ncbi:ferredoxin family protein [Planctomycetota bacterium]
MAKFSVKIIRERCKGCHLCIHFCEYDILKAENTVNEHGYFSAHASEPDTCRGCRSCYLVCPDMAVEIHKIDNQEGDDNK